MNKILLLLSLVATLSVATVVAPSSYTGKGSSSPLTAKGDLYTRSSTADARLAIGADGLVLVADSASANGMKWNSIAGTGDVVGPSSATDNGICTFNSTTGKLVQDNTGGTIDDNGLLTLPTTGGLAIGGTTSSSTFVAVRKDQNAVTRMKVTNGSAGASAVSQIQVTSSADDFNISAGSSGAGASNVTMDLTSGSGFTDGLRLNQAGAIPIYLRTNNSNALSVSGGQLTRMYQQASIGAAPSTDKGLYLSLTAAQMTGASQYFSYIDSIASSAATSGVYGYSINVGTAAASFTTPFVLNYAAGGMSKGSGSTITRAVNYYGSDQTVGTNNAWLSDNVSFTGDWLFNFSSTRASTFGGAMTVAGNFTNSVLTASRVVVSDSSKNLASSTMTQTKLESLTGEQIDAFVETPSAKTYTLRGKARYAGTINKVYLKTASGTITAKLQIAGVDVTSCTAISVSSTPSDTTCTAANTFAAGDAITLVTSSNSSSADLVVSVDVTR